MLKVHKSYIPNSRLVTIKTAALCLVFTINIFLYDAQVLAASKVVVSDNFRVVGRSGVDQEMLEEISKAFEKAYAEVTEKLGLTRYKSCKIEVIIVSEYQRYRADAYRWDSVIRVPLETYKEDISGGVFQHELTHILIDTAMPSAPTWFHEGLAMYIERGFPEEGVPKEEINFRAAKKIFKDKFSFKELEADFRRPKEEWFSYQLSYNIVSYLIDKRGFDKIKELFNTRGHFRKRFKKVYGESLDDFEAHLNRIIEEERSRKP